MATTAYKSGEKLINDETGIVHDFTRKHGVIMNEIILPEHAPQKYMDRQILWNEVQKTEKPSDAQLAREVEVAFPVEMTREQQTECVRGYIQENFIQEGIIADWALHDKEDGNPHTRIMLTMRGFDEQENWQQKMKSVFANSKDANGRPVYEPQPPSCDPKNKEQIAIYRIQVLDTQGKQKTRVRKGKGTEYLWKRSIFQQITGMTVLMQSAGKPPGQNTATDIWRRTGRSITVPMRGRKLTGSPRSTRARLPEPWNRRGR